MSNESIYQLEKWLIRSKRKVKTSKQLKKYLAIQLWLIQNKLANIEAEINGQGLHKTAL